MLASHVFENNVLFGVCGVCYGGFSETAVNSLAQASGRSHSEKAAAVACSLLTE